MKNRSKVHPCRAWTEEEETFIKERLDIAPWKLAVEFNQTFEPRTKSSILHKRQRFFGNPPMKGYTYWTQEEEDMVREFGAELTAKELAAKLTETFGRQFSIPSVEKKKFRMGIKSNDDHKFTKGQEASGVPFRQGENHFKWKPIGTIEKKCIGEHDRLRWCIKVKGMEEPNPQNRWILLSYYNWIQANGHIPEGYVIKHLDNDFDNCNIENLAIVSKEVARVMTGYGLNGLGKEAIETAELIYKIHQKDPERVRVLERQRIAAKRRRKEKRNGKSI